MTQIGLDELTKKQRRPLSLLGRIQDRKRLSESFKPGVSAEHAIQELQSSQLSVPPPPLHCSGTREQEFTKGHGSYFGLKTTNSTKGKIFMGLASSGSNPSKHMLHCKNVPHLPSTYVLPVQMQFTSQGPLCHAPMLAGNTAGRSTFMF